jgi:sorbitol/mannitol transport system permease protein
MVADAVSAGVPVRPAISPRREGWSRRLPLLPAVLVVFAVTQVPFVITFVYSLISWNLFFPTKTHFAGFKNYQEIFSNPLFVTSLVNTVLITVLSVAISLILGVLIALLLNQDIFGKGIVRTLMIAPFLVMPVAAALIWRHFLFDPSTGLIDVALSPLGFKGTFDWVNQLPMVSVITVIVWQWTPFMMLIVLAGLQSQNLEVLEAAKVDGARSWSTFRYITLPFLRPYLELGGLLGTLFILQTFDIVVFTTGGGGGSGNATTNIPYLLYLIFSQSEDIGQAAAVGIIDVAITILVASFALRTLFSIFHVEARR